MESDVFTAAVGDQKYTAVEYPGFVRNADKAVQALGGEGNIPTSHGDGRLLKLALRPGQPFAHPLYADAKPGKSLLLRISRPRQQPGNQQEAACKVQLLGVVSTVLHFNGMADYQYLPQDASGAPRDYSRCPPINQPETAEPTGVAQPVHCVPPLFSKLDTPFNYGWKQYTDLRTRNERPEVSSFYVSAVPQPSTQQAQQTQQAQPSAVASDKQTEMQVDAPHEAGAAAETQLKDGQQTVDTDHAACEQHVMGLFNQRPMWSLAMLMHKVPSSMQSQLQPILFRHTYKFKSGPWRGLYIRKGYDPRSTPSSKQYQAVHYLLPKHWYERMGLTNNGLSQEAGSTQPPSITAINKLQSLPTSRITVLQLCDLEDPVIQEICKSPTQTISTAALKQTSPASSTAPSSKGEVNAEGQAGAGPLGNWCNEEHGWLTADQWQRVAAVVHTKLDSLLLTSTATRSITGGNPAAANGVVGKERESDTPAAAKGAAKGSSRGRGKAAAGEAGEAGKGTGRGGVRGGRGRGKSAQTTPEPTGTDQAVAMDVDTPVKGEAVAAPAAPANPQPAADATAKPTEVAASGPLAAPAAAGAPAEQPAGLLQQLMQAMRLQAPAGGAGGAADNGDDAYEVDALDEGDAYELLEAGDGPGGGSGAGSVAITAGVGQVRAQDTGRSEGRDQVQHEYEEEEEEEEEEARDEDEDDGYLDDDDELTYL